MIADNVKVSLFGNISDGLYSAYVSTNGSGNQSAYVVTRKEVRDYFDGIVVAVAEFEGLAGARPIVSTYGEVFYEPELRRRLSKLKNIKLKHIRCLYFIEYLFHIVFSDTLACFEAGIAHSAKADVFIIQRDQLHLIAGILSTFHKLVAKNI